MQRPHGIITILCILECIPYKSMHFPSSQLPLIIGGMPYTTLPVFSHQAQPLIASSFPLLTDTSEMGEAPPSARSSLAFLAPISEDFQKLNRVIERRLNSQVDLIEDISTHLIQAGGKRLRPALLLLICGALGVSSEARHELAAVIEFIHTATLLHDDVVDESDLRRGRKTANALFGNAASVLVGDFLYSRAFQMMVEAMTDTQCPDIMRILSNATNVIAQGEVLQLVNRHDPKVDEARYRKVVYYKTATLFEASAQLGAVLADAPANITAAAADFGRHIGNTFQIMDDWLDYASDPAVLGKPIGSDLREGKLTLPLILFIQNGTPDQRARAQAAIQNAGQSTSENLDHLHQALLEEVRSSKALEATLQAAEKEADLARQALQIFPDSIYKKSLLELHAYSISRQY